MNRSPWLLPLVPSYTIGIVFVVVLVVGPDGTLTLGGDGRLDYCFTSDIASTGVFSVERSESQDGVAMFVASAQMQQSQSVGEA